MTYEHIHKHKHTGIAEHEHTHQHVNANHSIGSHTHTHEVPAGYEYRNFTGTKTERQPKLTTLDTHVSAQKGSNRVRTKEANARPRNGEPRFDTYRYYTAEQATQLAHAILDAADIARDSTRPLTWQLIKRIT